MTSDFKVVVTFLFLKTEQYIILNFLCQLV